MNLAPVASDHSPLDHAAIRTIVLGTMLAMFLSALDQTIVATALATIGRSLADVENLSWVVTAYLLTATSVTPLYGKLSDIYGRRNMLLVGIGIFVAGSIAAALSPSMMILIIARAVQGLGGGGLISLAQTIVGDVVSPRERGRYQGYLGMVFAFASIGGPLLGGFLAGRLHWSLIFWINLPLGLVAFLMTNAVLKRLPRYERAHRLDILGAAFMMSATILLLLALTWGGSRFAWSSFAIQGLLAGSVLLWVLFAIRLWTAREPFLPLALLFNPVVGFGTATATFVYGTMIGLTIFVPLYFEVVRGLSASESGLALIPLMFGTVVGSTATGRYMARLAHYKRMPVVGLAVAVATLIVLAVEPTRPSLAIVGIALALVGLGIGSLLPVTTVAVQNAVLPHQLGTAIGAMSFFRSLGGAIIVAVFGAIVLGGGGIESRAGISLAALSQSGRSSAEFAHVFQWLFAVAACFLAVGLLCLLIMEERPLRGHPARRPEVAAAAE
jgi:EmrB/QacA subfamily drug resistance transporter